MELLGYVQKGAQKYTGMRGPRDEDSGKREKYLSPKKSLCLRVLCT